VKVWAGSLTMAASKLEPPERREVEWITGEALAAGNGPSTGPASWATASALCKATTGDARMDSRVS